MAKTLMALVGEALKELGVKVVDNKLVVPSSENVTPAIEAVVGSATAEYNSLEKIEEKLKNIVETVSTDTERLYAINQLITSYEGADDIIKGLVDGKLGKDATAKNASKLENLSLDEVTDKAVEKFNSTATGTKEEFVSALGA